jgi:hypothetical protein
MSNQDEDFESDVPVGPPNCRTVAADEVVVVTEGGQVKLFDELNPRELSELGGSGMLHGDPLVSEVKPSEGFVVEQPSVERSSGRPVVFRRKRRMNGEILGTVIKLDSPTPPPGRWRSADDGPYAHIAGDDGLLYHFGLKSWLVVGKRVRLYRDEDDGEILLVSPL